MIHNFKERGYILEAVICVTISAPVRERELGAWLASDDDVDIGRQVVERQATNVYRLGLVMVVLEVCLVGCTQALERRHDLYAREPESQ